MRKSLVVAVMIALFTVGLAAADDKLATLPMTLDLELVQGRFIPIQNGRPMISFDPQNRPRLDLGGTWKKLRIEMENNFSLSPRTNEWLVRVETETGGATAPGYDDSAWAEHQVPGVENVMPETPEDPVGAEVYEGGVYYRRHFTVPAEWQGEVVRFVTLAADYVADLWINGVWVGYHEGGYTPFVFDVSSVLNYGGDNVAVFRVDAVPWGLRMDIIPNLFATDWQHYVGVVHDVYLEASPPVNIVRADVLTWDIEGNLDVSVVVENRDLLTHQLTVEVDAFQMDADHPDYLTDTVAENLIGDEVTLQGITEATFSLTPGAYTRRDLSVRIDQPDLWTPSEPKLYVLRVVARSESETVDSFSTQFGIRTVEVGEGAKVLLNGRPVFFTGMARHEDWPDSGRTATMSKIAEDLHLIRDANVWFLRTAHYPNHPNTYLLTDRMGFAVWEEIPAWWLNQISISILMDRGLPRQMWREMIFNGRNRPSVLFWSLCNEPMWYFVFNLRDYVQDLHFDVDANFPDGRLVSQALAADGAMFTGNSQQDVDVIGWNTYYGVFYGEDITAETSEFLWKQHQRYPWIPMIATEYGYWSGSDGSEEYRQVEIADKTLRAFFPYAAVDENGETTDGFLAGVTWWCQFNWYRVQDPHNQTMGLMHMDRVTAKPVHSVVREMYQPYFDMGGLGDQVPEDDDASDDDDDIEADDDHDENACGC